MGVLGFCFIIASSVALLPTLEAIENCYKVKGYIVPVFTPVFKNGSLNTAVIGAYAQYLNGVGADGVLVGATIGEGPTLNVSDNKALVDAWVAAAEPLNLLVTVSVGGVPIPDTLELAAYSEEKGVSAIFALPEVYFKAKTAEDLAYNIELIYQAAPNTPLVYDDVPEFTGVVVDIVRFFELATERIPTFMGLKSTSFETLLSLRNKTTHQQQLYLSDYLYLAPAVCVGFRNFILPEFNIFPKLITDIVRYRETGNVSRSNNLYQRLLDLIDNIIGRSNYFQGNFLIAVEKTLFQYRTAIEVGDPRPPIRPLTTEQKSALQRNAEDENVKLAQYYYD